MHSPIPTILTLVHPLTILSYTHYTPTSLTGRAGRAGASVLLYSPMEERKLNGFENALNFRFKKIGTPGPKEIAEASAIVAAEKLENVSPYMAKQFLPAARKVIVTYIHSRHAVIEPDAEEELKDSEELNVDGDMIRNDDGEEEIDIDDTDEADVSTSDSESSPPMMYDADGNVVYSAYQVEELMAR